MYFFKKDGKQYLDLTGNLILTYNSDLVKTRSKSAGPYKVLNARVIINAGKLNFIGKYKATKLALKFIWGKPAPLLAADTHLKTPFNKPKLVVKDNKVVDEFNKTYISEIDDKFPHC